jgi:tetratricopeptide (TPR) repeat protein
MRRFINYDEQRYSEAEAHFDTYLQFENQDAEAWRLRGEMRFKQGNNQGAIDDYTRAIELNPKEIYAYTYRCGIGTIIEKFDRAEKDCLAALELDENMALALNNLACLYYKTGEYKKGLAYAERAVSANLDEASYWDTRAHLLEGLGEKDLAISDFRAALKRNPNQSESIAGLKRLGVEI